jgi:hypothetical protein
MHVVTGYLDICSTIFDSGMWYHSACFYSLKTEEEYLIESK